MANGSLPTPDELRNLLDYDPGTGALTWRERTAETFKEGRRSARQSAALWNARYAGREATGVADGYRQCRVLGRLYRAHRVAWAVFYGRWPAGEVDHINGDRADNRVANLRDVSGVENRRNQKRASTNTSGATGVYWLAANQKWRVQIGVGGRRAHIGCFDTMADATEARLAAERAHGFHENHGRR